MDVDVLQRWIEQLARETEELERQVRPIQEMIQRKKEQSAAANRLLELALQPHDAASTSGARQGDSPPILFSLADSVHETLQREAAPLHYREIARRIMASGRTIPGENPEANLIAHISKDERFVRVARGTYALQEWNLIPAKKRRRGRRAA